MKTTHPYASAFALSCFSLLAVACSGTPETAAADDVVGASSEAISAPATPAYYWVTRADARKCAFPMCGGYYVAQVNAKKTRCSDGVKRQECYVADVDMSALGLDEVEAEPLAQAMRDGNVVVHGLVGTKEFAPGLTAASLAATEVWTGRADADLDGSRAKFYEVTAVSIQCVAAPCPTIDATALNGDEGELLESVDFSRVCAAPDAVDAGKAALKAGNLVVAATRAPVYGRAGTLDKLVAEQFYTPVVHVAPPVPKCGTLNGVTCGENEFCDRPVGTCGLVMVPGECHLSRGVMCAQIYKPVCGCDGHTYGNDCNRLTAQVSKAHDGACE